MKSQNLICGIDVSKDKLDTCYNDKTGKLRTMQVKNNIAGHNALIKKLGVNRTYVMESTGIYSLRICMKLKKAGADVRLENALVIKRFILMNMERHKSDKSDARWIYTYAVEREPAVWHMPSKEQFYCSQILRALDMYKRKHTMIVNHLHSYEHHPYVFDRVQRSLEQSRDKIGREITKMENQLDSLLTKWQKDLKKNLETIPGIGLRAVAYLIVYTDAFTKFENHRQLIAFAGTSPREHTSGSSIESRKGICKMGNPNLRKTMFMCTLTAMRYNKACKEMFERLKANGKKPKVALIAVVNKLLKQAFAIAKSGVPYDPDHKSVLPVKIKSPEA